MSFFIFYFFTSFPKLQSDQHLTISLTISFFPFALCIVDLLLISISLSDFTLSFSAIFTLTHSHRSVFFFFFFFWTPTHKPLPLQRSSFLPGRWWVLRTRLNNSRSLHIWTRSWSPGMRLSHKPSHPSVPPPFPSLCHHFSPGSSSLTTAPPCSLFFLIPAGV